MKVAKDPSSVRHYLHCLPSLKTSDIRCGEWKRKQCAAGTIFDPIYRVGFLILSQKSMSFSPAVRVLF